MRLIRFLKEKSNEYNYYSIEFDLNTDNPQYSKIYHQLLDLITQENNKSLNKNYESDKYQFLESEYIIVSDLTHKQLNNLINSIIDNESSIVIRKLTKQDIVSNENLFKLIKNLKLNI